MKSELILASGSARRIEMLTKLGLDPEVIPSNKEERPKATDPEGVVRELSRQKAEDIAYQLMTKIPEPDAPYIVLGADTVVSAGGRILGKPKSHEDAADMIRLLSGTTHQVFTGVTLVRVLSMDERNIALPEYLVLQGDKADIHNTDSCMEITFAEKTDVTVRSMTESEILAYANSDDPMDKAGAYGIQGRFSAFIEKIEGDYFNVVGLPVSYVYQVLKELGEV